MEEERKLELALDQASEDLRQSLNNWRSVDTKIYGLISLALVLVGLLLTVKPWSNKSYVAISFFVASVAVYSFIIVWGLVTYSPRKSLTTNSRAIIESIEEPYGDLLRWTVDDLLDFADRNNEIASVKIGALSVMLFLFLVATVSLALGTLLN